MAAVSIQALEFCYPGSTEATLSDLRLEIASGEAHALLGGSGAGKTTLLKLLSGLLEPTAGSLCLDGVALATLPPPDRGVAQVFQFPVLYDGLSLNENLTLPLRARGRSARERRARAEELATLLDFRAQGLDDLDRRKPPSLSLYQKQLLAIGKALALPSLKLLLLDEPLTAVEPRLKWALRRTLKAVQKQTGVTMIYVTHDQTEALTFAERISVMHEGRILQSDSPRGLYETPAERYVGHFIGSPGLNFVPAQISGGVLFREDWRVTLPPPVSQSLDRWPEGSVELAFRPEWTRVARDASLADEPCVARDAEADDGEDWFRLGGAPSSFTLRAVEAGAEQGLLELRLPEAVTILCTRPEPAAERVRFCLDRLLLFRDGKRLGGLIERPSAANAEHAAERAL